MAINELTSDSSAEEKKRKERGQLIINLINKSKILTISFTEQDTPIVNDFLKVARAEAGPRGFSRTAIKSFAEYVKHHGLGNPQLHLTTYIDPQAPSPMRVLCWTHLAGATTEGKVYCRKYGGSWIQAIKCYSCPENQLRKNKKEP
jgi:hypothetical protein